MTRWIADEAPIENISGIVVDSLVFSPDLFIKQVQTFPSCSVGGSWPWLSLEINRPSRLLSSLTLLLGEVFTEDCISDTGHRRPHCLLQGQPVFRRDMPLAHLGKGARSLLNDIMWQISQGRNDPAFCEATSRLQKK